MSRKSVALFVGDGTLLARCARLWMERGHAVLGVVSADTAVRRWAESAGLRVVEPQEADPLPGESFDYLFSVANLRVLPKSLLARARERAINFHDGPLPRYAGLHATSWALMAGEARHGVTWHEMTEAIDRGRIASQELFDLPPDETALSLNARCYEAGWRTFSAMVDAIEAGGLLLQPAAGSASYFGRDLRPQALGTIDWSQPGRAVCALVRALDFGPHHPNPLACPKVWIGSGLILVNSATVCPNDPSLGPIEPGTVTRSAAGLLEVMAADARVRLEGCVMVAPQGTSWPRAGQLLPRLDTALDERLAAAMPGLARGESHWRDALARLAGMTPLELPYPQRVEGNERSEGGPATASGRLRLPLQARERGASTLAAFAAWLCAICGQEGASLRYTDPALLKAGGHLQPWVDPCVPLMLSVSPSTPVSELTAQAESLLGQAHRAGPMTRDLRWRLGTAPVPLPRHGLRIAGEGSGLEEITPAWLDADPLDLELQCGEPGGSLILSVDASRYAPAVARVIAHHLEAWLHAFCASQEAVGQLPLTTPQEAARIASINETAVPLERTIPAHEMITRHARLHPHDVALHTSEGLLTHQQLQEQVETLAQAMHERGVRAGDLVGLCLERRAALVISVLAILRCGAAYVPLDPHYPAERLRFMCEDSGLRHIVREDTFDPLAESGREEAGASGAAQGARAASAREVIAIAPDALPRHAGEPLPMAGPDDIAYVIYTSGSTGRPKGVRVTHGNLLNFFAGMDRCVPREGAGRWLAVTSLSFDISVLELLWTLARGFTVVLSPGKGASPARRRLEFSLSFFASDDDQAPAPDRYRLLLEGARFADRHGFAAVWTPERHFHAFGGLYPNPVITSAALATITRRVAIRAGSCVLPLHHPLRVAEDWALVDNLSHGRVGVSFAAGWQPRDFVLAPQAFEDRKRRLLDGIATVRRLWRGESLPWPGPQGQPVTVQTRPRPVQAELPIWLTAASNPETFEQAGAMGCHVLTHLLGQSVDDVQAKVARYRSAWRTAGHAGQGQVTLMLHAFVGPDESAVRDTARAPMKAYLRSSVDLIRQAAWTFPTFVQRAAADGRTPLEVMEQSPLSEEEMQALLDHAFERYWRSSALIGTPEQCLAMIERLRLAGVDEIACLIDFGVETDEVLAHLENLRALMEASQRTVPVGDASDLARQILESGITHLQCTPSMASILVADARGREALRRLSVLLVGGEALPLALARELRALVPGRILNMYGPTETTVWSTCARLDAIEPFIPLGEPIANTCLHVRNAWGQECPALVPGELLIGGAGVSRGYLGRPQLDAERFLPDPRRPGQRLYRTGDLVRRHADGRLEFLGRLDHQVKIRGHRIELGEIEATLAAQPGVREAVVQARFADSGEGVAGDAILVGHVTAQPGVTTLEPAALRRALAQVLPAIMVPQVIQVHAALPLTPNGKTDRQALARQGVPNPQGAGSDGDPAVLPPASDRSASMRPSGAVRQQVAALWCEVLGLPSVREDANFFDIGGHSLAMVQVQRRLREATGIEISIADMFRLTTVASMASHLETRQAGEPAQPVPAAAIDDGRARARARQALRSRERAAG